MRPFVGAIDYPVYAPPEPGSLFLCANGMFPVLDAEFLFGLLCHLKPRRVVEVGSGFSSLVMADVNRRMLGGAMHVTCIEPYPRDFLVAGKRALPDCCLRVLRRWTSHYLTRWRRVMCRLSTRLMCPRPAVT